MRYELLATKAVPSHRLSRFTRYPKDTSNWPGWNTTIGVDIIEGMIAGVDYRFANHHYHPSTVANDGSMSTLDRDRHKEVIRRIHGSLSRNKEKVYVNVPILTVDEAAEFYISEETLFIEAVEIQEVEEKKECARKRKASDKEIYIICSFILINKLIN